MRRTLTAGLVAGSTLLFAGCVEEDEPPAPSLVDQMRTVEDGLDTGEPPTDTSTADEIVDDPDATTR